VPGGTGGRVAVLWVPMRDGPVCRWVVGGWVVMRGGGIPPSAVVGTRWLLRWIDQQRGLREWG
jgi:hypothetical protein